MKKSELIKILDQELSNTSCLFVDKDSGNKTIFFKNKSNDISNFKCYSYHDKNDLENDNCIWYFFVYEGGGGDYVEYMIPNEDSKTYIEMFLKKLLDFLDKKKQFDESLYNLRKLRGKDKKSEIRDYKLNKILNEN